MPLGISFCEGQPLILRSALVDAAVVEAAFDSRINDSRLNTAGSLHSRKPLQEVALRQYGLLGVHQCRVGVSCFKAEQHGTRTQRSDKRTV